METIIVVFSREEDAVKIRRILTAGGWSVYAACTSGSAALQAADRLGEGIVVCGARLRDMQYDHLRAMLGGQFEMVLLASGRVLEEGVAPNVHALALPASAQQLWSCLEEIRAVRSKLPGHSGRTKKPKRSAEETKLIAQAKEALMNRRHITEAEAHRYLQKASMDNGTGLAETAAMLLSLMGS